MSQARGLEVFETPDVPEESFNYDDDQKSNAIHQLPVGVKSSYDKFKGKTLDGKEIDFSDSITRPAQYGFKVQPDDYELVLTEREPETVLQRYHRLKQEVGELMADVERVSETQKDSEKLLDVLPADLLQDVQLLQKQLHGLQIDRVLNTSLPANPDHPFQSVLLRDLKTQLEALKSHDVSHDTQQTREQPVYEVFARTESAKFAHLSKLSEVEQRLAKLETLVGNKETAVSTVSGGLDCEQKDLSAAVLSLQAKVALLDPSHVNAIGVQLQALLSLVEQVETQSKAKVEDGEKKAKITEALERVALIGGVVPLIPDLVARLHALKDLHERASQFAGSVSYMSDSQSEMSKQINAVKQLLTELQKLFQENLSTVHDEFSGLEARLNKIQT